MFDIALDDIAEVSWPWWWFGGGFKLRTADSRYKITFVRPNGADTMGPSEGDAISDVLGGLLEAGHDFAGIQSGRAEASRWKEVLSGT